MTAQRNTPHPPKQVAEMEVVIEYVPPLERSTTPGLWPVRMLTVDQVREMYPVSPQEEE